jgi:hypothetical protein
MTVMVPEGKTSRSSLGPSCPLTLRLSFVDSFGDTPNEDRLSTNRCGIEKTPSHSRGRGRDQRYASGQRCKHLTKLTQDSINPIAYAEIALQQAEKLLAGYPRRRTSALRRAGRRNHILNGRPKSDNRLLARPAGKTTDLGKSESRS